MTTIIVGLLVLGPVVLVFIVLNFRKTKSHQVEEHPFSFAKMTVSGGVATYPHHATTATALLKAAEQALEQAKHSGRNRIVAYSNSKKT